MNLMPVNVTFLYSRTAPSRGGPPRATRHRHRLDSVPGARPQPINAALKQALERVGLEGGLRARGAVSAGRTAPLQQPQERP